MRAVVGVTDNDWAAFLRADPSITEANFWLPSGGSFSSRSLREGEPFLFKTKASGTPPYRIVGGGLFQGYLPLRVSDAWAFFGQGNGVGSEDELEAKVQHYRRRKPYIADPTIGCVMLYDLFFAEPGDEPRQPEHWASNWTTWRIYEPGVVDYEQVRHTAEALSARRRMDIAWPEWPVDAVNTSGARFGAPYLVRPRRGQRGFRAHVTYAYEWTCAITGSVNAPALEAAHIVPHGKGGTNSTTNGLLLRRDAHRLYDLGYLGIDRDYRLHVSQRLRIETNNGLEFYERAARGEVIRLPQDRRALPSGDALEWHMRRVFKSA